MSGKTSTLLVKLGGTAWLLLLGIAVILWLLNGLQYVDGTRINWRVLVLIFGGGGIVFFIASWIFSIWDD